jgi:hypothetical protein
MCNEVYEKGLSDEDAFTETQAFWPGVAVEECDAVCDDCWELIRPDRRILAPQRVGPVDEGAE